MRVKVLKAFRDRYTRILQIPNTEIEVTKERFEVINSTSLGILVEEIKEKKPTKKPKKVGE